MTTVQGGWRYLVAHNEDYMFFDVMYNLNGGLNNNKGQLMCYNRNDESWKVILEYSENEEGDVAYIEKHQRLIHEGYLYFEDNLFVPGGMNMSTAYRLNLSTMELENLGQNLKNPQLYEGDIWYIETTEQGQALKNVETGVSVELPSNVYQIAVIGDGVWVTYDTGVHSAQTTVSMKEGIDENIVGIPTASVFQSTDYIAWESSTIDVPELYSKKKQQVVSIDEISVGSHFYYLQDDYGLIESWIPRGNEPSEVIYTFFERVD